MPTILWIGRYVIFFWLDESKPLEPIHVHAAYGQPSANSAKIWITSEGKALLEHNKAMIPLKIMRRIIRVVEVKKHVNTGSVAGIFWRNTLYPLKLSRKER